MRSSATRERPRTRRQPAACRLFHRRNDDYRCCRHRRLHICDRASHAAQLWGTISVLAAGTLIPQMKASARPGATGTPGVVHKAGSFFRIWQVPTLGTHRALGRKRRLPTTRGGSNRYGTENWLPLSIIRRSRADRRGLRSRRSARRGSSLCPLSVPRQDRESLSSRHPERCRTTVDITVTCKIAGTALAHRRLDYDRAIASAPARSTRLRRLPRTRATRTI
jgi:hypothetical protein